jgi:hypothetical protein
MNTLLISKNEIFKEIKLIENDCSTLLQFHRLFLRCHFAIFNQFFLFFQRID